MDAFAFNLLFNILSWRFWSLFPSFILALPQIKILSVKNVTFSWCTHHVVATALRVVMFFFKTPLNTSCHSYSRNQFVRLLQEKFVDTFKPSANWRNKVGVTRRSSCMLDEPCTFKCCTLAAVFCSQGTETTQRLTQFLGLHKCFKCVADLVGDVIETQDINWRNAMSVQEMVSSRGGQLDQLREPHFRRQKSARSIMLYS
jgi:hypothetical protein